MDESQLDAMLVNDRLQGLRGRLIRVFKKAEGRLRYRVTVIDAGGSGFEKGSPVSDWAENWESVK